MQAHKISSTQFVFFNPQVAKAVNGGFLAGTFIVTLVAAIGKGLMLLEPASLFVAAHPLLPWLSVRQLTLIAVVAEVIVLITILARPYKQGLIAVTSLYSVIAIYRGFLFASGISYTLIVLNSLAEGAETQALA